MVFDNDNNKLSYNQLEAKDMKVLVICEVTSMDSIVGHERK